MNRRGLLRGLAAGVGGGAATLAGVTLTSESARGQATLSLDVTGDEVELGADKSITAVRLSVDVDWQVALPAGVTPETRTVTLAAGVDDVAALATDDAPLIMREASGTVTLERDLLATDALAAATVRDGATLQVRAGLRVTDGDGVVARASASDTAPLTVTQAIDADAHGAVGGAGGVTIETG